MAISYNAVSQICTNYVTGVLYNVEYDTTTGRIVSIDSKFTTSTGLLPSTITQTFEIQFNEFGNNAVKFQRSGNPGYILGSNILAGTKTTNGQMSAINYIPDSSYGITMPSEIYSVSNSRFQCSDSTDYSSRTPITFGNDLVGGCTVYYSLNDLNTNCDGIRATVYQIQTLTASALTHVGIFGNATVDDIGQWVPIVDTLVAALKVY